VVDFHGQSVELCGDLSFSRSQNPLMALSLFSLQACRLARSSMGSFLVLGAWQDLEHKV
jgi:hypothetical protein